MSRKLLAACALGTLALAALGAPFLKADRFAGAIRAALEQGLGRTVEINGPIRFSLVGRGFSIDQVVIHEDPKLGAEPFAYVETLEATLRLAPLLRGRFEFERLQLVAPSVNLAKARSGGWNAQPLLEQVLKSAGGGEFPEIGLSGARLNFRIGEWKSPYYLGDAELRVEAASEQELSLYIEGEPARTDRGLRGFGRFSGRGRVRVMPGRESELDLNLTLTRSPIAELMMLSLGQGSNLAGFFSGRASLEGPLSRIGLRGRVQLEDLERFDWLLGSAGGPGLNIEGTLNLPGQTVDLHTSGAKGHSPFDARLRGADLMGRPRWAMLATAANAPAASVQPLVAELGFAVPGRFQWNGVLSGAIGYDERHRWQGGFRLSDGSVSVQGGEVASFAEARMKIEGERLLLTPAVFRLPNQETVRLEGEYSPSGYTLRMQSAGVSLQHLKSLLPLVAEPGGLPLLHRGGAGRWHGSLWLTAALDGPPVWQADGEVSGMKLAVPGLASELELARAQLSWKPQDLTVSSFSGRIGATELRGSLREQGGARKRQELALVIEKVQAGELERLLLPALRRRSGFLVRALGMGANDLPEWMSGRRIQGGVRIGQLEAGGREIAQVAFRFHWQGPSVSISEFTALAGGGVLSGAAKASLEGAEPAYEGTFALHGFPWRQGVVDGEAGFEAAGTGQDLLRALRIQGNLRGRNLALAGETRWTIQDAPFTLLRERGIWRWQFPRLQLENGEEPVHGTGASAQDGRIVLDLVTPAGRARRMSGRLAEPAWEFVR